MKKRDWSKDGMKQLINSGWKEFDRQTNCITMGNAICNTQFSSCIRPWKERECNGLIRDEGDLLDFDLRQFSSFRMPNRIKSILKDRSREKSVILYMFFVTDKDGVIRPFCWAVTNYDHKLIDFCVVVRHKESYIKRLNAALEAISYITN